MGQFLVKLNAEIVVNYVKLRGLDKADGQRSNITQNLQEQKVPTILVKKQAKFVKNWKKEVT